MGAVGESDVIAIVEAAYALASPNGTVDDWLRGVLAAATPLLGDGHGVLACLYDTNCPDPAGVSHSFILDNLDPRLLAASRDYFEQGGDDMRDWVFDDRHPVRFLSQACGSSLQTHIRFAAIARELAVNDVVSVRAANPDGRGVFLGAYLGRAPRHRRAWIRSWTHVVAHIAAGRRLRHASRETLLERAEAVLTPSGRVLSVDGAAVAHRARLHDAARAIDRARSRLGRRDPETALEAWSALVEGRWSLVDHFESDGRRIMLALPNVPGISDPRGLAAEERMVLGYLTIGHSNKRIAYELGLPEGTIARRVSRIARKLGVRSRVGIIDRWTAVRTAKLTEIDLDGTPWVVAISSRSSPTELERLTGAEREVVELAARGLSSKAIAARRGSAVRTVDNLLATTYRKLGLASRAELAAWLGAREPG